MKPKTTAAVLISMCFAGMGANAQLDWTGELAGPGGGYPRMAQQADGTLLMGVDHTDGLKMFKSPYGGAWSDLPAGGIAVPAPASTNVHVGNVFPLVLPGGNILIAGRHLNDVDGEDNVPDGTEFFNVDIHRSTDGGATWSLLSSPINHPDSPGGGVVADQNNGVWEPFLYQRSPTEIWCLYSRQNGDRYGGSGHPFPLNMKRSTDGGANWSVEETIVGTNQFNGFGYNGAGMSGLVEADNGDLIAVFETDSPTAGSTLSIGMVRSTDGGTNWSAISDVYAPSGYAGAPYIVKMDDGTLVVSYQHHDGTEANLTMGYVTSANHGSTWIGNTDLFAPVSSLPSLFVDADGTLYGLKAGVTYKKHYPGGIPNTIAHWRFEEGSDGAGAIGQHADDADGHYLDVSGFGNPLSTWEILPVPGNNWPTYTTDVPYTNVPGAGANDLALDFDGSDDIVTMGNIGPARMVETYAFTNGWTVEATFKTDSIGVWQGIVGKDGKPNAASEFSTFWMKISDTGNLDVGFVDDALADKGLGGVSVNPDSWYSIAVTYDNPTFSLYLRDETNSAYALAATRSDVVAGASLFHAGDTNSTYWTVGRAMWNANPENYFTGIIDEVKISDVALSTGQFINQNGFNFAYVVKKPSNLVAGGFTGPADPFTLSASEYWSPTGLLQTGSQWQISASNDFSVVTEWDSGTAGATNAISVPGGSVSAEGIYYARVKYQGTGDEWSEWSDTATLNLQAMETFDSTNMPSYMETTGNGLLGDNIVFDGSVARFDGQGDDQRQYLRTKQSNLYENDFVMEITHFMNGDGWWEAAWVGMGEGTFDPLNFYSPAGDWIGIEITGSGTGLGSGIKLRDGSWASPVDAPAWTALTTFTGPVTNRYRLTYTAATQSMDVDIDQDYVKGTAFVADISSLWTTWSGGATNNADAGQFDPPALSHIFFGTAGNGSWFDDFLVTPALVTEAPPITIVSELVPSGLALTWDTASLFDYRILEKSSLTYSTWSTNQSGIPGSVSNVTVTIPTTNSAAFYKVESE